MPVLSFCSIPDSTIRVHRYRTILFNQRLTAVIA
jgi:hypothetical protein